MFSSISLTISHIVKDPSIDRFDEPAWEAVSVVPVSRYWSGKTAPDTQQFSTRLFWSDTALYVRFDGLQSEPLIVSEKPDVTKKTIGLWERDVCEIFIAPDVKEPRRYFEFEVAPTAEWLDLAIDVTSGERVTDWEYRSGVEATARIEKDRVLMAMRIPWEAFGRKPETGDVWLGNIFRCIGREPDRGYLAWSPTMTEEPNFHVPERFGRLIFDKN